MATILTQSYCKSHIVSDERLKTKYGSQKDDYILNIASIPPAMNTESVGFNCSSRISINLPTFAAFRFSVVFLFTLLKNRLEWIISCGASICMFLQ